MTPRTRPPLRRDGVGGQPPDGALARLTVSGRDWTGFPPAPGGADITVSVSSVSAAAEHTGKLTTLGYRVVGVAAAPGRREPVAVFLVPRAALEADRQWWRALSAEAEATFSLALGPVLAAFAGVLRTHREPLR